MNLKEILKKNDRLRRFVKCVKIKKDFKRDAKDFCGNYMEAKSEIPQLEYSILLIVHSLEKGLSSKKLRPFGNEKVKELIQVMNKFPINYIENPNTPFIMGVSILKKWKQVFDENRWEENESYKNVKKFLKHLESYDMYPVGSFRYTSKEALKYNNIDYLNAIKSRHSVREFSDKKISKEEK